MVIKLPNTVKMVITDFDGIMTDNCVYISDNGDCSRKINFKDVMGIHLLKKNGFELAIISGEKNRAIELLAEKFDVKEIHMNIRKKIDVLKSIVEKYSLLEDEFVYIGDDVNDLECLEFSKYRITVPHAPIKLKQVGNIQVTGVDGGEGAFREVVECLIG